MHDGSNARTGGFAVRVSDGDGGSAGPVTVDATVTSVNDDPTVSGDLAITVAAGGRVALTPNDLAASDDATGPAGLTFTATNVANGRLALQDAFETAITSFTQAQLAGGRRLLRARRLERQDRRLRGEGVRRRRRQRRAGDG